MNREFMSAPFYDASGSYHADLSSDPLDSHGELIDLVVTFAFETLGASHSDLHMTSPNYPQGESFEHHSRTHR